MQQSTIATGDKEYINRIGKEDYEQSVEICNSNPMLLENMLNQSSTPWSPIHACKWKKGSVKPDEMSRYEMLEEFPTIQSCDSINNTENINIYTQDSNTNSTLSVQQDHSQVKKKYKASSKSVIQSNLHSIFLGWTPFNSQAIGDVTQDEIIHCTWPPSASILLKLGLAPADDSDWYSQYGMLPPALWTVTAAMKRNGYAQSTTNNTTATTSTNSINYLEGNMHTVVNCWLPSTLTSIEYFISSDQFFIPFHGGSDRKKDMLT